MSIPAPALFAMTLLLLWPAAQIACLLTLRMRLQKAALRGIELLADGDPRKRGTASLAKWAGHLESLSEGKLTALFVLAILLAGGLYFGLAVR